MKRSELLKVILVQNKIELTEREIRVAVYHGVERVIENWLQGKDYNAKYNRYEKQFDDSISGCLGELAFAKFLGAYPEAYSFRDAPDVAGYEVRTIRAASRNLIVKEYEAKSYRRFVLVFNNCPHFTICGWIATDDPHFNSIAPRIISQGREPVYLINKEKLLNFDYEPNYHPEMKRKF